MFLGGLAAALTAKDRRPNILIILADDLGYSDLGCYGGEIHTPNLDGLAKRGLRFVHFYTAARCCPSRASLLSGLYPHQTGIGGMTNAAPPNHNLPGYQGRLNNSNVLLPEVLREAGYTTLMSGKWHLGAPGPAGRGFEEFYGLYGGFTSFWDAKAYTRLPEGRSARQYKEGEFYATNAITDHALDFLNAARKKQQPWFLYLAYNAPHFPLHAPKHVIDKYVPVYEQGWDVIRTQRFERLKSVGIADRDWRLTPRSSIPRNTFSDETGWTGKENPAWKDVPADRQKDLARRMAIFAAMVEEMDRNVGRVVEDLRKKNELDNTLILFLSDNGACAEWDPWGFDTRSGPQNTLHRGADLEKMGQPGTYHSYGSGWANASNTPFRLYKHYSHEGGISTPMIAHWPAGIRRRNELERQPCHLIDIMPTLLIAAGAHYPLDYKGKTVPLPEGVSLTGVFDGRSTADRGPLFFEHEGNRAVRENQWKLVAVHPYGPWELYDLFEDPMEMNDVAAKHPQRVQQMSEQWVEWAERTGALPWTHKPSAAR